MTAHHECELLVALVAKQVAKADAVATFDACNKRRVTFALAVGDVDERFARVVYVDVNLERTAGLRLPRYGANCRVVLQPACAARGTRTHIIHTRAPRQSAWSSAHCAPRRRENANTRKNEEKNARAADRANSNRRSAARRT